MGRLANSDIEYEYTYDDEGGNKLGTYDRKYRKFGVNEAFDCTHDLINEIFDKPTRSSECPQNDIDSWPDFMQTKGEGAVTFSKTYHGDREKDYKIKHIEYLPYVLFPQYLDNFRKSVRELSSAKYRHSTKVATSKESVQFWIGTANEGRTLLIFFPGTENIPDIKVDLSVKHHSIKLPNIVPQELRYTYPERYLKGDEKGAKKLTRMELEHLYSFRVHHGIHTKLFDGEIQRGLQEELLFLYSGFEKMASIPFGPWCLENNIPNHVVTKLYRYNFAQFKDKITGKPITPEQAKRDENTHYTRPAAMDIRSDQFQSFVRDPDITKKDIEIVATAIKNLRQKHLERARVGMRTAKVQQLIIAGHS